MRLLGVARCGMQGLCIMKSLSSMKKDDLTRVRIWIRRICSIFNWELIDPRKSSVSHFFRRWSGCNLINTTLGDDQKKKAPWKPSWIGADRMSSANGSRMRWKPAGSVQPVSSSFSSCKNVRKITWPHYRKFETCGKRAQKTGEECRRSNASTRPIFFFLIMDRRSALNVRLLPEYD